MAVHSLRCRAVHKHAYVFVCGGEGEVLGEILIEDEAVDGVKLIKIISCFPNSQSNPMPSSDHKMGDR